MTHAKLLLLPLLLSFGFSCTSKMSARSMKSETVAKPTVTMTASFKSLADLPRCDDGTAKMNAYISERDVFVQCRGFFWRDVKPGDASGKYLAREPLRYNEWVDAKSKIRWSAPKQQEVKVANLDRNICSNGWKLPTQDELHTAAVNGLFEGMKSRGGFASDKAWTANLSAIVGLAKGEVKAAPSDDSEITAAVYCMASL
jgi:hypothetical protein